MTKIITTIVDDGPFFVADPTIPYWRNVQAMMEGIAAEGEDDVRAQLEAGEGGRAPLSDELGRVSFYVDGRVKALAGRTWFENAVISPDRSGLSGPSAIALYAGASRIEGKSHVFRRTATRLRNARAINKAELVKGLT